MSQLKKVLQFWWISERQASPREALPTDRAEASFANSPKPWQNARLTPTFRGRADHHGVNMPSVKVRENEPFEFALRRFKRTCEKAGILAETRKREFYEKPTMERKRKAAAAVKRNLRRTMRDVTKRQRMY